MNSILNWFFDNAMEKCNLASCKGFEYSGTVTPIGDLISQPTFTDPYIQPIPKNDRKRGFQFDLMFSGIVSKS